MAAESIDAGRLRRRERVAYWAALVVFVLFGTGAVLLATLAPISPDDPPVKQVETLETQRKSDGTTTTVERHETTNTGEGGGSILGWKIGPAGAFALQITAGLLVAYLVATLVHRVCCGHYALKLLGMEFNDRANQIAQASDQAHAIAEDRLVLAEDTTAEQAGLAPGIQSSSEPVDEDLIIDVGVVDIVFGLSDLGSSLAGVLRDLLAPPPRTSPRSTDQVVRILANRGVLTPELATTVERVLRACRAPGDARNRASLDEIAMAYGPGLVADLKSLRGTAALAFEEHVLGRLGDVPRCSVRRGTVIREIQVDAIATRDKSEVIVEVRARVGPGATKAVKDARDWLRGIPAEMPVLLIVPTEPSTSPEWEEVLNRVGLRHLPWDERSGTLAGVLNSMLTGDGDRR